MRIILALPKLLLAILFIALLILPVPWLVTVGLGLTVPALLISAVADILGYFRPATSRRLVTLLSAYLFTVVIIPAFASLPAIFLAGGLSLIFPGPKEWNGYNWPLALCFAVPLTALAEWKYWKKEILTFSARRRDVAFSSTVQAQEYSALKPLPYLRGGKTTKTSGRRPGTIQAKIGKSWACTLYGGITLAATGLHAVPVVGILLMPLSLWIIDKCARKIDAASVHLARLEAPTVPEALAADGRKPVLLLRSFKDDGLDVVSQEAEASNSGRISLEELIFRQMAGWGPLIAIGQPSESSPRLGAARAYYRDHEWEENAVRMLEASTLVVLLMGETPSVALELRRILELHHFSKTVILFPPTSDPSYRERVRKMRDVFEQTTGRPMNLHPAPDRDLIAVTFTKYRVPVPISSPGRQSLCYVDALQLASKVIHHNQAA